MTTAKVAISADFFDGLCTPSPSGAGQSYRTCQQIPE